MSQESASASTRFARYQGLQRYVGWTEKDAGSVGTLLELLRPEFVSIIDDFYQAIQREPATAKVITGGAEQIARLKRTLCQWLEELFCGQYDEAYVARRWRVGWRHVDIGLDQVFTIAAVSRLGSQLHAALIRRWAGSVEDLSAAGRTIQRLLDLDLMIIEDAYQTEYIRRFQQAERLGTLGQVSASIAHELRNPLNVIRTSAYYLVRADPRDPEKMTDHLARIERQVVAADAVITALSRFARLPVPECRSFPLRPCLQEVIDETGLPEQIEVALTVEPPTLQIHADREQLRIVFSNLIRNARDALAEQGAIRVSAGERADHVWVEVADNGCGIAPDDLRRIAQPLYSTKARGLGLGLAISKAIVEKHGGEWLVASELGKGARFTLRFQRPEYMPH